MPVVGHRFIEATESSVVLPQPLRPSTTQRSPSATDQSMGPRIVRPARRTVTSVRSMITGPMLEPPAHAGQGAVDAGGVGSGVGGSVGAGVAVGAAVGSGVGSGVGVRVGGGVAVGSGVAVGIAVGSMLGLTSTEGDGLSRSEAGGQGSAAGPEPDGRGHGERRDHAAGIGCRHDVARGRRAGLPAAGAVHERHPRSAHTG